MGNTPEKELKISIGDIFTDDENYPKRAEWCNTNGCRIVELTPDKEGRRFEIRKKNLVKLRRIKSRSSTPRKINSWIPAAWSMKRIFLLTTTRPFCVYPAQF